MKAVLDKEKESMDGSTGDIDELKKKLTATEKELKETLQRMSSLVQKRNQPLEEMAAKADKLEGKLAEEGESKKKLEEQVQRLQDINGSIQTMFDNKMEKVKLEYDLLVGRLERQVKKQSDELSKKSEVEEESKNMSGDVEDLQEVIKAQKNVVDEKTRETLEMKMQVEELSMAIMERDQKLKDL